MRLSTNKYSYISYISWVFTDPLIEDKGCEKTRDARRQGMREDKRCEKTRDARRQGILRDSGRQEILRDSGRFW